MKKVLLLVGALAIAIATVPLFAAFEAHVINVTAHIENALGVHPEAISFGTVFPQEYLIRDFTVTLSDSFLSERRVDDVDYVIKQKPKCKCDGELGTSECPDGQYAPVGYATHVCPQGYTAMLSLCPYLSKVDGDPQDQNDTSHPSYYTDPTPDQPNSGDEFCNDVTVPDATGHLAKSQGDLVDLWLVDLKVPPVDGTVGQDWPARCPVVEQNNQDYGCDLWIEVTGISTTTPQ